jgi:hypothetical protein
MIIGLIGYKQSGKSTVADYLAKYGFVRQRFAQPLKDMLKAIGLTDDHVDGDLKEIPCDLLGGRTPREAMQLLGTEWGRKLIHPDLWIILWKSKSRSIPMVVVDDTRFPNEAQAICDLGGTLWRISRPNYGGDDPHESEYYIDKLAVNYELDNSGTIDALKSNVDKLISQCL